MKKLFLNFYVLYYNCYTCLKMLNGYIYSLDREGGHLRLENYGYDFCACSYFCIEKELNMWYNNSSINKNLTRNFANRYVHKRKSKTIKKRRSSGVSCIEG